MNPLLSYFDKVFVLNLDRRADRWKECVEELRLAGLRPEDYERVPAVDDPDCGNRGCARTHLALFRSIAANKCNWRRVLVLEDDVAALTRQVLFYAGFHAGSGVMRTFESIPGTSLGDRFASLVPFIPEHWNMLFLGGAYGERPISRANTHIVRCGFIQGLHSYGITRQFATVLAERLGHLIEAEPREYPFDQLLGRFAHDHFWYILQPRLTYQRTSQSDICGETKSSVFAMTDLRHESMV